MLPPLIPFFYKDNPNSSTAVSLQVSPLRSPISPRRLSRIAQSISLIYRNNRVPRTFFICVHPSESLHQTVSFCVLLFHCLHLPLYHLPPDSTLGITMWGCFRLWNTYSSKNIVPILHYHVPAGYLDVFECEPEILNMVPRFTFFRFYSSPPILGCVSPPMLHGSI